MSPGEQAFRQVRPGDDWRALSDDERDTWERGASMPPVGATLRLVMDEQRKER